MLKLQKNKRVRLAERKRNCYRSTWELARQMERVGRMVTSHIARHGAMTFDFGNLTHTAA